MQDKTSLRRQLRRRRASLPPQQRRSAEHRVLRRIVGAGLLRRGMRLGIYLAVGSELRLDGLNTLARQRGTRLFVPLLPRQGRMMRFGELGNRRGCWRRNQYGIREYHARPSVNAQRLHAVLMPLVGFDRHGGRLGQGGGYYDATFARHSAGRHPQLIGIAFECQRIDGNLPLEQHDVRLDCILTEATRYQAAHHRQPAVPAPDTAI